MCNTSWIEELTDKEINFMVSKILGKKVNENKTFDPCNNHDHAWLVLETLDCTMDIDGSVYFHEYQFKIQCKNKVLRAAMIGFCAINDTKHRN